MDWGPMFNHFWQHVVGMVQRTQTLPENVHKHRLREQILDALQRSPGKHLQEICDELGVKRGTATWHLRILERAGAIDSVARPHTHHFFPAQASQEHRAGLAILRRERAFEVVGKVLEKPGIVQAQLIDEIGMSRKVFRDYANDLVGEGLVLEIKEGANRRYTPTPKLDRLLDWMQKNGHGGPGVPQARPPQPPNFGGPP